MLYKLYWKDHIICFATNTKYRFSFHCVCCPIVGDLVIVYNKNPLPQCYCFSEENSVDEPEFYCFEDFFPSERGGNSYILTEQYAYSDLFQKIHDEQVYFQR